MMHHNSVQSFRLALLLGIGFMVSSCSNLMATPVQAVPDPVRVEINRLLTDSAAEWSSNDLDGFVGSYEESPETTYVSGQRLIRGFDAIKAMYASHFGGRTPLGRLSVSLEEVRPLGTDFALAVGRYQLTRVGHPDPASGIFTLVFHHTPAGWKIVSDHTSS